MIFNILIVSPHGYFGQEGVLGKPDTGGQVVYILDQVKALEKEMINSLNKAGIECKTKDHNFHADSFQMQKEPNATSVLKK